MTSTEYSLHNMYYDMLKSNTLSRLPIASSALLISVDCYYIAKGYVMKELILKCKYYEGRSVG